MRTIQSTVGKSHVAQPATECRVIESRNRFILNVQLIFSLMATCVRRPVLRRVPGKVPKAAADEIEISKRPKYGRTCTPIHALDETGYSTARHLCGFFLRVFLACSWTSAVSGQAMPPNRV